MRVNVAQGVQVVHDGKVYADGESADAPTWLAQFWIRSGWASEQDYDAAEPKRKTKRPAKS